MLRVISPSPLGPLRVGWLYALGLASGVITFTAPMLASARDAPWWVLPNSAPTAIGIAAVLLLLPLARRGAGVRAAHALAWSLALQFTIALLGSLCVLTRTIVRSRGEGYADSAASACAEACSLAVAVVVCATLPSAMAGAGRLRGPSVRTSRAIVGALAILCVAAAARAHRCTDVEGYVQRLPVLGTLPAIEPRPDGSEQVFVHDVGPVRVRRVYAGRGSTVQTSLVVSEGLTVPLSRRSSFRGARGAATVRHDARLDAVIVETAYSRIAFRLSTGESINITHRALAPWHAPPRSWIASALVGLALALSILAWPRRVPESILRWRAAREGALASDVVTLADDTSDVRLAPDHGLDAGPVLVLDELPEASQNGSLGLPFRDAHGPHFVAVTNGTRQVALDAIATVEDGPRLLAVTVAVVSSSPLLVAAALGNVL